MKHLPKRSKDHRTLLVLMVCCVVAWFAENEDEVTFRHGAVKTASTGNTSLSVVGERTMPAWSNVQPANHGTNPIPAGFMQTAVYEDVARLAFPTPAPVAAGLRARVLLGEISGATGRHKYVRIEEVANTKENRLVERRVMPAAHVVVSALPGKTEAEVRAGLPEGYIIRKKLLGDRRYIVGFESKDANSLETATTALKASPVVASAVPDGYVFSASIPNDPLFPQQWGLRNTGQSVNGVTGTPDADISAPEAWGLTTGSSAVTVAVIDSGIDLTHEDLIDNIWTNPGETGGGKETNGIDDDGNGLTDDVHGWDFVNDDNVPQDIFGHGTHVAGIIGAKGNNGVGITGVSWNVSLAAVRVLGNSGIGTWSDVLEGVAYAQMMKLPVANLSLGAYGQASLGVQTSFGLARDVLFCAAAGNGGFSTAGVGDNIDVLPFVPAALPLENIISVAAVGPNGTLAPFSNFGHSQVDIGAPGVGVLSTKRGGGYHQLSGTSMAAAFVSGAAAMLHTRSSPTALEARHALQMSVTRTPRLTGQCASQGRLALDLVAVQAAMNVKWRQLDIGAVLHTGAQIRPDGQVRAWPDSLGQTPFAQAEPQITDALAVLKVAGGVLLTDGTVSVLDGPLEFDNSGLTEFLDLPAPGAGDLTFRKLTGFTEVMDAVQCQYFDSLFGIYETDPAVIALRRDGSVWSAGPVDSYTGQGSAAQSSSVAAAPVAGLSNIIQIAANQSGADFFALRADGAVFTFGKNEGGGLGLGTSSPVTSPTAIPGLPPVRELFVEENGDATTVICLAVNGQVWGWSEEPYLLGGTVPDALIPTRLTWFEGCHSFYTSQWGSGATYAVRTSDGQLLEAAIDDLGILPPSLETVSGLSGLARAPRSASVVSDRYGAVWVWGANKTYSPEGSATTNEEPIAVPVGAGVVECVGSSGWAIALQATGVAQSWGNNYAGNLANGISPYFTVPMECPDLLGASGLHAVDTRFVIAWWPDGAMKLQGEGRQTRTLPFLGGPVLEVTRWGVDLEALLPGNQVHAINLFAWRNGTAVSWAPRSWSTNRATHLWNNVSGGDGIYSTVDGRLDSYRNTLPTTTPLPVGFDAPEQIQAVYDGASADGDWVVRTANGSLWTLRSTGADLTARNLRAVPGGNFIQVAWPIALKADGTVWQYANVNSPPTEVSALYPNGSMLAPVVQIASSKHGGHFLPEYVALRSDGTLWTWGQQPNANGSIGDRAPALFPRVADATHIWGFFGQTSDQSGLSYVRRVDGSIWGWGDNSSGAINQTLAFALPTATTNYNFSTEVLNSGLGANDWLTRYFSDEELGSINISGDEADPDRDGLTNLVEYALGSNPKISSDGEGDEVGLSSSFESVSSEALSADGAGGGGQGELHFTVKLKRRAKRPGIEYRVEFSDDMVNWSSSPSRLLKVLESEKTVIYRDIEPLAVTPRRWARLVIRKGN